MGTTAATGSPLRMMTVGLPFCARVITAAKWARTSRTFILLSSSVMVLMYPDLCTCRVPQASTTRLPSSVIARASLALAPSIASPTSPRRGGCPGLATPTPLCSRLRSGSTSVEKSARGACLVLRCEAGEGFACGGHYLLADPRTDDRGKGWCRRPSDLAEANAEAGTAQHPDEPQGRQDGARDHAADGDGGGKQEKHRGRLYGHPRRQPRGRPADSRLGNASAADLSAARDHQGGRCLGCPPLHEHAALLSNRRWRPGRGVTPSRLTRLWPGRARITGSRPRC